MGESDSPSELFDFLQTTHSQQQPLLETPCRRLFADPETTPAFVKTTPPSVSTNASGSETGNGSPNSSQTASTNTSPTPAASSLRPQAPEPGKKFGFGNAFKPSNLQFRSMSTESNLDDQATPSKSDIEMMKNQIDQAKEFVKKEKKTGKTAAADDESKDDTSKAG